jgi:hypothetical protein
MILDPLYRSMSKANTAAITVRLQPWSRHDATPYLPKMGMKTHRNNRHCKRIWEEK